MPLTAKWHHAVKQADDFDLLPNLENASTINLGGGFFLAHSSFHAIMLKFGSILPALHARKKSDGTFQMLTKPQELVVESHLLSKTKPETSSG